MPQSSSVSYNDIRPNKYVLVRGTLVYSRIASRVEGEELANIQRERQQQGRPAPQRPYTYVTIVDPQIVKPKAGVPKTTEELFVESSKFYTAKTGKYKDHVCFAPLNNGNYLPSLYRKGNAANGEEPKQFYKVTAEGEIAPGTPVLILMRSFAGQMNHNGIAMNAVMVLDDHIPYYGVNNADVDALKQWGLVINDTPDTSSASTSTLETERVSSDAPVPVANNSYTDDITYDPAIAQGISLDALFDAE